MTKQEQDLINAINNFELNQENIPVELVSAYSELRMKFNLIRSDPPPKFTENNITIDMKYWNDWKFIGMNHFEFITTEFYKTGFQFSKESE